MKASKLVLALNEAIKTHGDQDVVVHDGMDPSDLCYVNGVLFDKERVPCFELRSGTRLPFIFSSSGPTRPECERIVGQIAQVLAKNSPFLDIIKGGTFENKRSDS